MWCSLDSSRWYHRPPGCQPKWKNFAYPWHVHERKQANWHVSTVVIVKQEIPTVSVSMNCQKSRPLPLLRRITQKLSIYLSTCAKHSSSLTFRNNRSSTIKSVLRVPLRGRLYDRLNGWMKKCRHHHPHEKRGTKILPCTSDNNTLLTYILISARYQSVKWHEYACDENVWLWHLFVFFFFFCFQFSLIGCQIHKKELVDFVHDPVDLVVENGMFLYANWEKRVMKKRQRNRNM